MANMGEVRLFGRTADAPCKIARFNRLMRPRCLGYGGWWIAVGKYTTTLQYQFGLVLYFYFLSFGSLWSFYRPSWGSFLGPLTTIFTPPSNSKVASPKNGFNIATTATTGHHKYWTTTSGTLSPSVSSMSTGLHMYRIDCGCHGK